MKQKMKHHLRIAMLLLGILSCFTSYQKDDFKKPVKETGESRVKHISLSAFNSKVGGSKEYRKLSNLFDGEAVTLLLNS
jgi:Neuraminidase (sialidase)